MTGRLRRLSALAAVFAPTRAEHLLSLVAAPWTAQAGACAAALARRSRADRLAALAAALADPAPPLPAGLDSGPSRLVRPEVRGASASAVRRTARLAWSARPLAPWPRPERPGS